MQKGDAQRWNWHPVVFWAMRVHGGQAPAVSAPQLRGGGIFFVLRGLFFVLDDASHGRLAQGSPVNIGAVQLVH